MNQSKRFYVAPSLLSADFSCMHEGVKRIVSSGADLIHMDIMDGSFVPNITFGSKMVADIRAITSLPLDVHLMVVNPENHIEKFAEAGADTITFHYEAAVHVHRIVQQIKQYGKKAGISIVPSTPAMILSELLPILDVILIMTVNPGFGGQKLIPSCLEKVQTLDGIRKEKNYSYLMSVDGGINLETGSEARASGADILITGSTFFSSQTPAEDVIILRGERN